MLYRNAKNLHAGDEVKVKETGEVLTVLWIEDYLGRKDVFVHCEDGNAYHHKKFSKGE